MIFDRPAGAERDMQFRLPDGRVIDLPAMRWVLANRSRFAVRLGLTAFLRMLPLWLLNEVEVNADRDEIDTRHGVPTSATILTLEHVRMWSPRNVESADDIPEDFPVLVQMFEAACALERLRRYGVLRLRLCGEDRIGRDHRFSIEINPAVMAEVIKSGSLPHDPSDAVRRLGQFLHIAAKTDWGEAGTLDEDGTCSDHR